MNISPSNIFQNMLLDKRFHQNHQAVLAAMSIDGLRQEVSHFAKTSLLLMNCLK